MHCGNQALSMNNSSISCIPPIAPLLKLPSKLFHLAEHRFGTFQKCCTYGTLANWGACRQKPKSLAQLTRDISAFASRTKAEVLRKETPHLGGDSEMERCFVANAAAGFTKRDRSGWKMIERQNVSLSTDRLQCIGANSQGVIQGDFFSLVPP